MRAPDSGGGEVRPALAQGEVSGVDEWEYVESAAVEEVVDREFKSGSEGPEAEKSKRKRPPWGSNPRPQG